MSNKIIINAENAILGRLASYAAKQALLGKDIIIVNAEKAVIVGKEKDILEKYRRKKRLGGSGLKGPFFSVDEEKIMKRTIRGMLSYKQERGRNALKRIKCYKGIPKEFENKEMVKGKGNKGLSLERLSKLLKGE